MSSFFVQTAVRGMTGSQRGTNVKKHHLFVKVPPKNSARFEKMVKRNRTLEHEVKVYTELIRDLKRFVKDRVGNEVDFNVPTLYHGCTTKNDPGPNGDRSVLVIEDLGQRGNCDHKLPDISIICIEIPIYLKLLLMESLNIYFRFYD